MPTPLDPRKWGTNGTLVGAPVTIDIQVLAGFVPQYVEVHNIDPSNNYTCQTGGVTYFIPFGQYLAIPGDVPNLVLNGTGGYVILASQNYGDLPSLKPTNISSIGAGSTYTADEDTLTLDVALHTFSVKDADQALATGLTHRKVLSGLYKDPGMVAQGTFFAGGGNAVPGDDVTIIINLTVATFIATAGAPVLPTEYQVGGNEAATLANLEAAIVAHLPNIGVVHDGSNYLDVWSISPTDIGAALFLNSSWLTVQQPVPNLEAYPRNIAVFSFRRNVTADDVTRGLVRIGLPDVTNDPISVIAQLTSVTGQVKSWDGDIDVSINWIDLTVGNVVPFVDTDVLTVQCVAAIDS